MDPSAAPRPSAHDEVVRLVDRLEHELAELGRLQHAIAADTEALGQAAACAEQSQKSRDVFSIPDAARHLGLSVSTLHKLLKEHRLGHLKVRSRTLITAEHLAEFRRSAQVESHPRTGRNGKPETVDAQVHQLRREHPIDAESDPVDSDLEVGKR